MIKRSSICIVLLSTILAFSGCGSKENEVQGRGGSFEQDLGAEGRNGKLNSHERVIEDSEHEDSEHKNSEHEEIEESSEETHKTDLPDKKTNDEEKDLELVETGYYLDSEYGDYLYYCGIINNPNEELIAQFPEVTVTVKDKNGAILATDNLVGSVVLPGDTVTLVSLVEIPGSHKEEDLKIEFDLDWDELTYDNYYYSDCRTTDFEISNISEVEGEYSTNITCEIKNNYSGEVETADLSLLLRKDGKIVYMNFDLVDGLKAGKTKAFQFELYDEIPEHDEIEISAQAW